MDRHGDHCAEPSPGEGDSRWRWLYETVCALLMGALAFAAFTWFGLTLWTALLIAIAVSCPIAAILAWWQSERAQRDVNRTLAQLRDNRLKREKGDI